MINETNLTKLAFVLAANGGGSGSGSSSGGGGVMVIGIDETTNPPRLNKTWQEIFDCVSGGALPVLMMVGKSHAEIAYIDILGDGGVSAHGVSEDGTITTIIFTADSPDDYPVMNTDDSGGSSSGGQS